MLSDNGEKIDSDLLASFLMESTEVVTNLKIFLTDFTDPSQNVCFEKFGQQIDRIMGAAYTLSLNEVGNLAKLGKELGYKASQVEEVGKLITVQSLLSQLVRALESILKGIKKGQRHNSQEIALLINRLTDASLKLGDLRVSVKV